MTTTPPAPDRDRPLSTQEEARAAGLDVAPSPAELRVIAESIVSSWGDRWAEPDDLVASVADSGAQLARAVPLVLAEVDRLRAEVSSLSDELTGRSLALYEEELDTARLRLALASAQRGRRELRARVAELEARPTVGYAVWCVEQSLGDEAAQHLLNLNPELAGPTPASPDCTCPTPGAAS
ncbi:MULTISPECIES: hypothetical protein [Streptomyces]|uniref:Uncharacterized protein n=1 Tax=Streptomyces flavovirens TaxID=52258 RepID=A0ABV8NBU8_9ACTN|nr:hypothetical protein [Streptomyces sp. MBT51]MBK3596272.1 hypothetical protein [Streptomyces sp. MBT51]